MVQCALAVENLIGVEVAYDQRIRFGQEPRVLLDRAAEHARVAPLPPSRSGFRPDREQMKRALTGEFDRKNHLELVGIYGRERELVIVREHPEAFCLATGSVTRVLVAVAPDHALSCRLGIGVRIAPTALGDNGDVRFEAP